MTATEQPEPTLVEFVRFNSWANQQLLAICMGLEGETVSADITGSAGSILETFGHLLRAEAGFLYRIHGTAPRPDFDWEANPSLKQMAAFAEQLGEASLETVEQVWPTQNVHEEANGWTFDYHARLIFMSYIYHGIAHRTDITTFLNKHGVELPELDVWGYQEDFPERFDARLVRVDNLACG